MNGGRNYNGPKVKDLLSLALVKLNYMREYPQKMSGTHSLIVESSKNSAYTGTIRREGFHAIMEEPSETSRSVLKNYYET